MERNDQIEEELFPFYALDALTDEERAEVESYVAGNPAARARLDEAMSAVTELVMAAEPLPPDPAVKARLMARVASEATPVATSAAAMPPPAPARPTPPARQTRPARGPSVRDFFFGRALGFAVLLVLLGGFGLWRLWQQTNDLRAQVAVLEAQAVALQSDVDRLQTTNETLWAELAARDETLAQYRQPGAVTVAIGDATGEHPAAVGTLTLVPDGGATLTVANLPPPPADSTYQAWLIVGGAPISAGTFAVDATGQGRHLIADAAPGSLEAVGVSLEPSGGSEQPTPGNIILLGSLDS
ncbi:MAG: anti-sigma factor [Candidatus Promineofilum sp.]|nr:anti-sigma factor [Promineifilum sp.]